MGEYAKYRGESVKIGTCEDMYYLRADQRHTVNGSDADYMRSTEGMATVRFRFPFPDEDNLEPGHFEDYSRGVRIPGYTLPKTLSGGEHGIVQFTASAGYNLCLPCPEQFPRDDNGRTMVDGIRVNRNGWKGGPVLRQQALRDGKWVSLVYCGACDGIHRLDTLKDAEPVIEAFRAEADRKEYRQGNFEPAHSDSVRAFYLEIAARIEAGYFVTA